jgi:hypothetical protein
VPVEVTLLLCDAAQESGGKLYVLGGGWSGVKANIPATMALAVLLEIPWDMTNHRMGVEAVLMTADGQPAEVEGQPVHSAGEIEVGRPPGVKPGTSFNAPLAFTFNGVSLDSGAYRWEFHVDGTLMATAPFRAETEAS